MSLSASARRLALYAFLMRAGVNVTFIVAQTALVKSMGVRAMPYAYAAMNLLYVAVQAGWIRRLSGEAGDLLGRLIRTFVVVGAALLALGGARGGLPCALLLLAVMVFDLVAGQFFLQLVAEVLPLQDGKSMMGRITAAGSLGMVLSGGLLAMAATPLGLTFTALVALGLVALSWLTLVGLCQVPERAASQGSEGSRPAIPTTVPPVFQVPDRPALVGHLVRLAFLTALGKYWLDYQYTWAVDHLSSSVGALAGFFAMYGVVTDLTVLAVQSAVAGPLLTRWPLVAALGLGPLVITLGGVALAQTTDPRAVIIVQWIYTVLVKSLQNPAQGLVQGVLPRESRLGAGSRLGLAASAGCGVCSLALVATRESLSGPATFLALAVVGAIQLVLLVALRPAYVAQVTDTLRKLSLGGGGDQAETLARALPVGQWLERLGGDESDRLAAVDGLLRADPEAALPLLAPLVASDPSPRVRSSVARALAARSGPGDEDQKSLAPWILRWLEDASGDSRTTANLLEGLAGRGLPGPITEAVRLRLEDESPRVRAAAAAVLLGAEDQPDRLRQAARVLHEMSRPGRPAPHRAAAVAQMGHPYSEAFLVELIETLGDPDPVLSRLACDGLSRFCDPAVADILEAHVRSLALQDPRLEPAFAALQKIRLRHLLDQSGVTGHLTHEERERWSSWIRSRAGLGGSEARGDASAAGDLPEGLLRLMVRGEPSVRRAALGALEACDDGTLAGLLGAAVDESSRSLRVDGLAGLDSRPGALSALLVSLHREGALALHDQLLAAHAGRLEARLGADSPSPELDSAIAQVGALAARRAIDPERAREAVAAAMGIDAFAASLAREVLDEELGRPLAATLAPLFSYSRRGPAGVASLVPPP